MINFDFNIDMRIKDVFFDTAKVKRSVDKATRKALSRAGAFIRTTARRSIRKRKGISKPGNPPSSHEGDLRRLIFFGLGPDKRSVIIGPVKFNQRGNAPQALEHGGFTTILKRNHKTRKFEVKQVRIAARPFMAPALEEEIPKLPKRWHNSVR